MHSPYTGPATQLGPVPSPLRGEGEGEGLEVLRFSNLEVLQKLEGVLTELLRWIEARAPHPSPLPSGERGPE